MFQNDKYSRSKLTLYSTKVNVPFTIKKKGNFTRKAIFWSFWTKINNIWLFCCHFWLFLVVFQYLWSFRANFWVSEGQNQVNVQSKMIETWVLAYFQVLFGLFMSLWKNCNFKNCKNSLWLKPSCILFILNFRFHFDLFKVLKTFS